MAGNQFRQPQLLDRLHHLSLGLRLPHLDDDRL